MKLSILPTLLVAAATAHAAALSPSNLQAAPVLSRQTSSRVSPDGTCGGTTGFTCPGSIFGRCCGGWGLCGDSFVHCGLNCQQAGGICERPARFSPDGTCGGGLICPGTGFGDCCSKFGKCGEAQGYCGDGCQERWGKCANGSSWFPNDA
ncbi:hypothetical protein ACN47E_010252 [Coniothyrium glycines]